MEDTQVDKGAHNGGVQSSVGANYGQGYLKWKNWEARTFGAIKKSEKLYFSAEIKKSASKFPAQSKVLEIGFGNGSFLAYGKSRKWDICGTEANADLVESASLNGFRALHTDSLRPFPSGTFDLVVAFDVIEHIPPMHLLEFLEEVKRVLKANGVFIARFPNGDSPFGLSYQNGDVTHVTTIGSGKAKYFVDRLGVEPIYIGGEAQPLWAGDILRLVQRIVAIPVRKVIDILVKAIFYPRSNMTFCSPNLVMIFRRPEDEEFSD